MSILRATEHVIDRPTVAAPYRCGDRVCAVSPEGVRYLVRVEAVTAAADGHFTVVGAVRSPRRYRSHLLSTVVDANGYGPAIRPAV